MKIRIDVEVKKQGAGRNYSATDVADQLIEEIEGLGAIFLGDTEYDVFDVALVYNEGNDPAAQQ